MILICISACQLVENVFAEVSVLYLWLYNSDGKRKLVSACKCLSLHYSQNGGAYKSNKVLCSLLNLNGEHFINYAFVVNS